MRQKLITPTRILWLLFILSLGLFVVGAALYIDQNDKQAVATRGWEFATRQDNLPVRLPMAGVNVELTQYSPTELSAQLDAMVSLGFTWLRQPFYWQDIESSEGNFDWSRYDTILATLADYPQLQLVALLDGTPAWARYNLAPEHPFAPPASAAQFGNFARALAERYGDSIDYYQIWDEPNLRSHWGNLDPQPALYVAMLKTAYTALHAADENASVILAALAPTVELGPANYNDITYLRAIYTHGGGDYFDAAAGKPYGYSLSPLDRSVSNGNFNFSRLILLREELVKQGDADKPIWGSNFGWNHLPNDWQGPPSVWGQASASDQITFTRQAYERAAQEWPWLAGLIVQHWQPAAPADDPIQGFAIAPNLSAWQADGPLILRATALISGYYPAQNDFTTYDGDWQFGPLGADSMPIDPSAPDATTIERHVNITFYGTEFALDIRRYSVITGYYIVTIDGQPANALPLNKQGEAQIVLKAPGSGETVDLILVAENLPLAQHTATITHRPRQGDDAWALAGMAVAAAPDTSSYDRMRLLAYILMAGGLIGLLLSIYFLPWRKLQVPSRQSLINLSDTSLMLLLSAIFILGTALTAGDSFTSFLRRDPPAIAVTLATLGIGFLSPISILSALALAIFAILVFNRPILGLMSVAFWSMFFTTRINVYFHTLTAVEAMLVISTLAIIGRQCYETVKSLPTDTLRHRLSHLWQRFYTNLYKLTLLDHAVIAFVLLAIISISWADLRSTATHELRVMVLGPAAFYLLLRLGQLSKADLALLADIVIIGGTIIALLGLRNYISGNLVITEGAKRLLAVYGSPNSVALQLGRCIPFALAYAVLPVHPYRRIFGLITTGIMLIAFILTQSIGGLFLGLPAALAVMLLGWQGQRIWRWLILVAVAGLAAIAAATQLIPRFKNLTNPDSSTALFRVNIWRSTRELLKDHPLTGVGLDQFLYAYRSRYILPEGAADPNLSHPHNIILDYWVRLGIVGVMLGLLLQFAFWQTILPTLKILRHLDPLLLALALGTMGMMADFLAHGMVDSAYFTINLSFIFMLVLALAQCIRTLTTASTSAN